MTHLEDSFPGLRNTEYRITSPINDSYNCIAWAAQDTARFWWPVDGYWPSDVPRELSLTAFRKAYARLGFEPCRSCEPEPQVEKIALFYNRNGAPTHAARQLSSGRWTSKLGRSVDIEHELNALEGDVYGRVAEFLKRPVA